MSDNNQTYFPKRGDKWDRDGPVGTLFVQRVQLPSAEHYDGGLPGVSIVTRQLEAGTLVWKDFFVVSETGPEFAARMQKSNRELVKRA